MQIDSKKDIRLIGRSLREGWPVSESVKQEVIDALTEIVINRDPDLMIDAIDKLLKADKLNIEIDVLRQRELKENEDRRLQLLELAQRIPIGDLARLTSGNGIVDGIGSGGRADEPAGVDGTKASGRKRPKNTAPKGRRKKIRVSKRS